MAKEDLPDNVAVGVPPPGELVQVVRKEGGRARPGIGTAVADGGAGVISTSLAFEAAPDTLGRLPVDVGVQGEKGEADWGSYVVKEERFLRLEVDPTRTIEILARSGQPMNNLYRTRQQAIIQWTATPQGETMWEWADDLANYELVDGNNRRYLPNGVAASVVNANGGQSLVARYDAEKPITSVPMSSDVKPTEVILYWVVPGKTSITSLDYKKERLQSLNLVTD
jgi:hypothetical protein